MPKYFKGSIKYDRKHINEKFLHQTLDNFVMFLFCVFLPQHINNYRTHISLKFGKQELLRIFYSFFLFLKTYYWRLESLIKKRKGMHPRFYFAHHNGIKIMLVWINTRTYFWHLVRKSWFNFSLPNIWYLIVDSREERARALIILNYTSYVKCQRT